MAELRVGVSAVEASAVAQIDSTTGGMLVPRMTTTQRDAITTPATSLLIYNTTTNQYEYYGGSGWVVIGTGVADTTGELFIGAASIWPSTTAGCAEPAKVEFATNDVDLYVADFDPTTRENAQFGINMPDDWDGGTITFKAIWTVAAGTGDVVWGLEGRSFADDEAIDQAWGTPQTVTDTVLAAGDFHFTAESAAITLAGTPAAGEYVQFRVYRDAGNAADTVDANDARLIGLKIYYGKA